MNTYRKLALVFGLLLPFGHAAFAQQLQPPAINPAQSEPRDITIFGEQSPIPVTRAPYSAIEESLYSQKQPDGTYEDRSEVTTHIYRDSQRRTRAERYVTSMLPGAGEPRLSSIFILEPQAGILYRLDPENHAASQEPWDANARILSSDTTATLHISTSVKVLIPPEMTESLGSQTMEGLAVEGTRQTVNLPASEQSNDLPFTIVTETWISPELKVAVLTKRDNSIVGKRTTRLTKIDRSEPDPSLFEVPADYKIEDTPPAEEHSSVAH
jgi:hypothetical protein